MTVGNSHASMSEKSRLESCEKQIVHQSRQLRIYQERLFDLQQEIEILDNKLEDAHQLIFRLEQRINTYFSGNDGEQVITNPDSEM